MRHARWFLWEKPSQSCMKNKGRVQPIQNRWFNQIYWTLNGPWGNSFQTHGLWIWHPYQSVCVLRQCRSSTFPRWAPPAVYIRLHVVQHVCQRVFNDCSPTHVTHLRIHDKTINQHHENSERQQFKTLQITVL